MFMRAPRISSGINYSDLRRFAFRVLLDIATPAPRSRIVKDSRFARTECLASWKVEVQGHVPKTGLGLLDSDSSTSAMQVFACGCLRFNRLE